MTLASPSLSTVFAKDIFALLPPPRGQNGYLSATCAATCAPVRPTADAWARNLRGPPNFPSGSELRGERPSTALETRTPSGLPARQGLSLPFSKGWMRKHKAERHSGPSPRGRAPASALRPQRRKAPPAVHRGAPRRLEAPPTSPLRAPALAPDRPGS